MIDDKYVTADDNTAKTTSKRKMVLGLLLVSFAVAGTYAYMNQTPAQADHVLQTNDDQQVEQLATEDNLQSDSLVNLVTNNNCYWKGEKQIPASICYWIDVRKYSTKPSNAVECGYYAADGPGMLYCGRRSKRGEVCKYNIENNLMWNMWCPYWRKQQSGQVLTGDSSLLEWKPYSKNKPLPRTAILGGFFRLDGALYIGRQSGGGEVGKINISTDGTKMWNFYSAGIGKQYSGEILCTKPLISAVHFSYELIAGCQGRGLTTLTITKSWKITESRHTEDWTFRNTVQGELSVKWAKGNINAGWSNEVRSQYHKVLTSIAQEKTMTKTFNLDCSGHNPFNWYVPKVSVDMLHGGRITYRQEGVIMLNGPAPTSFSKTYTY